MTPSELALVVNQHRLFLQDPTTGAKANLRGMDLSGVDLSGADLRGAVLNFTDLTEANLSGANLTGANLYGVKLRGANLTGTVLTPVQGCPANGEFLAYKKVNSFWGYRDKFVLEVLVPEDALRTSSIPYGTHCRASKVKVVRVVESPSGLCAHCGMTRELPEVTKFVSMHNSNFIYRLGEFAVEPKYDPDIRVADTRGIHFFLTVAEAQKYPHS